MRKRAWKFFESRVTRPVGELHATLQPHPSPYGGEVHYTIL